MDAINYTTYEEISVTHFKQNAALTLSIFCCFSDTVLTTVQCNGMYIYSELVSSTRHKQW